MAAVAAASIATERALPMALTVAGMLIIARWAVRGAPFTRTLADWPILGLMIMSGLSLLVTARMDLTAPQVGRLWLGIAFFYTLVDWTATLARARIVFWGLAGAGLVLCLGAPFGVDWALAQYKFSFIPQAIYDRFVLLSEDTINPNVMAGYLALLISCVIAPLMFEWSYSNYRTKTLYILIVLLMATVLILTQSRAGFLAAVVSVATVLVLRLGRREHLLGLLIITLALIGVTLAQMASTEAMARRMELWSRGWYMVQDFAITGIGMGSFQYVTEQFYPLALQETLPHSHNLFLQVAVDLGVPGLVAWLFVFALVTRKVWQTYNSSVRSHDMALAGFAAGLLAAQIALVIHGLFDAVTWGMVRPAVLIWGIWAAAVAIARLETNERKTLP